ncbi:MAG: GrpB family protein [Bdellovibrionaceae bacterium]|nr:GrpB family protein [Pseudobdellovibrionaceae bacterium]
MLARPEIDILVSLKMTHVLWTIFQNESVGYTNRGEEPGAPGHWYFSKNQEGRRTHKLHLCGPSHPCVENQILFRDLLNQDVDRAQKYAQLKRQLSENNKNGMIEYLEGKAPFIEETIQHAKQFLHLKNKPKNLKYSTTEQWSECMKDFRYGTLAFIPSGDLLKTGDQLRSQYDPNSAKSCPSHITITQPLNPAHFFHSSTEFKNRRNAK